LKCKEIEVDQTLSFGSLNFGAAELDTLLLNGRMATGTSAGGSSLGLGATYAYGEAIELRYNVTSWTGIGSSFKALYLRSEADLGGSYGLRCAELYGVMDTSTTTGLSNLQVLYTEMLVKASASNRTLTGGNSIEANISIENQTGTLTLTNNIYCLHAKAQTGTGINDYTKVNGIKVSGRDDGTARVFGVGLDISDPEATVCTWTKGISVTTACATGISVAYTGTAVTSKAFTTAGFTLNNAALTDGYGIVECDLTLTGTCTNHNAALSAWVNINTGTTGAYMVCAQTNGVYEASGGTLTNTTVIFGMRMQSLLAEAPSQSFPFSCVSNTNVITALFSCNAGSSDMGTVANAGSDTSKLVPLYKETSTGTTYYVKLYSLSG
jgi:hypothetical protein